MKYEILFLVISAITTVAAVSDDEASPHPLRPTAGLSTLDQIVSNAYRERIQRGQMDPIISFTAHKNVDFTVPPMFSPRGPLSISADAQEIRSHVLAGRLAYNSYNERIQQLLFERLMIMDTRYDPNSVRSVDHVLAETYSTIYNRLFNRPQISARRQTLTQELVRNIMISRLPLIQTLRGDTNQPDRESMVHLRENLQIATALEVGTNPYHPDERMLSDLLRGLRAIQEKVLQPQVGE